ncbi:hypothetical protein [Ktedonospora formicarum]|uniref:Uncharacterized protein n=1 Tax=Ktedonospora formicarum TaxID=2778364 RepID=A0A8J3I5H9_9CHLR|nr:hypothetical protein [Ktedonospora formicarum]GHO45159.1 hypothetical protein KSX_33220 [Ktedonospora formicarum]
MMNVAAVKSRAAAVLLLHLVLSPSEVALSDTEARELLGSTSRTSVWNARNELVELGFVEVTRSPSGYIYRLTEPVSQEPGIGEDPVEIDPLDQDAAYIDAMDTTGSVHQPHSPYARRRLKLMAFIERVMNTVLPTEKPFDKEQRRQLAEIAEKNTASGMGPATLLLTMIRRYSVGNVEKYRPNMFAYIKTMVRTEGTTEAPQPQSRPVQKQQQSLRKPWNGNEDGLSDEEIDRIRAQKSRETIDKYRHLVRTIPKLPLADLLGDEE